MTEPKCDECGVTGVKLWREYGVYSTKPAVLCVVHACAVKDISPDLIDARGCHESHLGDMTDQIGWYVPSIPCDDEDGWWGYTSIPMDAYDRWAHLPTRGDSSA